jgi:hypothetical protein
MTGRAKPIHGYLAVLSPHHDASEGITRAVISEADLEMKFGQPIPSPPKVETQSHSILRRGSLALCIAVNVEVDRCRPFR